MYLRVSRQEQEEGFSLDGQLVDCRRYCDLHGYRVVRIIREVGSGRDPDRPGLALLAELGGRGAFDVLVVWRRDRFGRRVVENALLSRDLKEAGVRIETTTTGPVDDSDEQDLMTTMLDAVAEYESKRTAVRIRMGLHTAAQQGNWPCRAPYGYRKLVPGEAGPLVIEPDEASRIRAAFAECLLGANKYRIALMLGTSHSCALDRLRNPAYKGQATYGGHMVPVPAIVPPEVWERAQAAIDERKAMHKTRMKPYEARALTGHVSREAQRAALAELEASRAAAASDASLLEDRRDPSPTSRDLDDAQTRSQPHNV